MIGFHKGQMIAHTVSMTESAYRSSTISDRFRADTASKLTHQPIYPLIYPVYMSLFQNSWGSRVFEGVSGLGVGQAGAGSYLNSLIS